MYHIRKDLKTTFCMIPLSPTVRRVAIKSAMLARMNDPNVKRIGEQYCTQCEQAVRRG